MNKIESNNISFNQRDFCLPVPNEIFQKIIGYLDSKSIQAAIQVNSYFAKNTLENTRIKENALVEEFAKFLLKNLNKELYQDQINELIPFCNTTKILFRPNLAHIKLSISELRNKLLFILKSLNIEELEQLKKLSLSSAKPSFFEDIFDIAIAEVSKIYQELDDTRANQSQTEREHALQKVCQSFIRFNNIHKAIELVHEIANPNKKTKTFKEIFELLIKQGKIEKCIDIFDRIDDNQLKLELFYYICIFLTANGYYNELSGAGFINKIEDLEKKSDNQIFLETLKKSIIFDIYEILIPLEKDTDYTTAINLAYSLNDPGMKIHAFSLICQGFVENNGLDQALTLLDSFSSNLSESFKNLHLKVLFAICDSLIKIRNIDKALEIVVARASDQETKDLLFFKISASLARERNYKKALKIAARINDQAMKDSAFFEVSASLAREKNYNKALKVAARINDQATKDGVFFEVIVSLAREGNYDKAIKVAQEIKEEERRQATISWIHLIYDDHDF